MDKNTAEVDLTDTTIRPSFAMSEETVLEEMDQIPLFMRNLSGDVEDNVAIQALQALVYDGTPEENAQNFKNQGNECFKEKKWKDAAAYYTQALNEKCGDQALNVACLTNRAAANLELGNYRMVLTDCAAALRLEPSCIKALYRSAKACRLLEKYEDAIDACLRGIEMDKDNTTFRQELALCKALKVKHAEKQARIQKEKEEREKANKNLLAALKIRNVKLHPPNIVSGYDIPHCPKLDAVTGHISYPLLFLYPSSKQTDLCVDVDELETIYSRAVQVLSEPPPWDIEHEFKAARIELYVELRKSGADEAYALRRIDRTVRLAEVLSWDGVWIEHGTLAVMIVSLDDPTFRGEWLRKYAKVED